MVRDLPLALTAVLVGRLRRIPVVLDMAENYPAMIQDVWDAGRARLGDRLVRNPKLIALVERMSVRLADHVLVVVDESRDRLAAMGVPASKMSVVMNTPSVDRAQEPGAGSPRNADGLVIAYLGLLEAPRGLGTAIEAMREVRRRLPGARLRIIGSGRDEALFREQARQADVTDRVEFLGWLDYGKALNELAHCDVGLVPHHATASWQTTIPNKLFDYMSLGKPVIVSNARPTERIVTEERCGLVFADQDAADAGRGHRGHGRSEPPGGLRTAGRDAIVRRYNWEADERRLLAAVRGVTEPTRIGAPRSAAGLCRTVGARERSLMCGIAGIGGSVSRPVDEGVLRSMNDALWHRGPDDDGFLVRDRVGLGHAPALHHRRRRRPAAHPQRGQVGVGGLQRRDLQLPRAARRPAAARAPLLHAAATPRPSCTCTRSTVKRASTRLRGMFAYALWDERRSRLLVARDRLGIKPLYYGRHDGRLYFASELRAFARVPGFRGYSNQASVQRYWPTLRPRAGDDLA